MARPRAAEDGMVCNGRQLPRQAVSIPLDESPPNAIVSIIDGNVRFRPLRSSTAWDLSSPASCPRGRRPQGGGRCPVRRPVTASLPSSAG